MRTGAQIARDHMWKMGGISHVEGSLGFVHWRGRLHVVLLIGDVNRSARTQTRAEKLREIKREVIAARGRAPSTCARCSGLDHKRSNCRYAGVQQNKTSNASRRRP